PPIRASGMGSWGHVTPSFFAPKRRRRVFKRHISPDSGFSKKYTAEPAEMIVLHRRRGCGKSYFRTLTRRGTLLFAAPVIARITVKSGSWGSWWGSWGDHGVTPLVFTFKRRRWVMMGVMGSRLSFFRGWIMGSHLWIGSW